MLVRTGKRPINVPTISESEAYLSMLGPRHDGRAKTVIAAVMGIAWYAVRFPILMLMVLLEPVVRLVCAGVAILGVLTTMFFELVGPPSFPFLTMLTISLGFAFLLVVYYATIRLLAGESR